MADYYEDEIGTVNEPFVENIDDPQLSSENNKKIYHDEDMDMDMKKQSSSSKKSVHKFLGGGKLADVFLWRNKTTSASVLGGATALWVLFELLDYHLITLVSQVLMVVFGILFLWSNTTKLINRSPPSIPQVRLPEDTFRQVAGALSTEINHLFDILRDLASGRDFKKFIIVVTGLWFLSIVGGWCDFLTLIYIGIVVLHTVPILYEKYEEPVDAFAEKTTLQIKKQYAVLDDKVLSKAPRIPLKEKKND